MYQFPDWFGEFRSHQEVLIDGVMEAFRQFPVVILEAPTGTGKTLVAEATRQNLAIHPPANGGEHRTCYLCSTKQLQRQFVNDFPYAHLLQGRNNYPTLDDPGLWPAISADDCTLEPTGPRHCAWCDPPGLCPYTVAKARAWAGPLSILNTAYWLREVAAGDHSRMNNFDLVVVDECDRLESELMGFIEIRIPEWLRTRMKERSPRYKTKPDSWVDWIRDHAAPAVWARIIELNDGNPRHAKTIKRLRGLSDRLTAVKLHADRWVMIDNEDALTFKPVWVSRWGREAVWDNMPGKALLMSATVISDEVMARNLGLKWENYAFIPAPSIIPPSRRPVAIRPKVDMSRKAVARNRAAWADLSSEVLSICNEWPGVRILIHAVSYALAKFLKDWLDSSAGRPVISVGSSRERDTQLAKFKDLPNAVLIAPAFERGVDLKDDLCRVIIWAKIPFPDLSDPQTSARLYSGRQGKEWYAVETIRSIVQGCGRAVRGPEDWGISYILDAQILRLLNENRGLWPRWFLAAVDMTGGVAGRRGLLQTLPGLAADLAALTGSGPGRSMPETATSTESQWGG